MPPRAVPVMLTAAEPKTLKMRVRGAKTPYRDRVQAQIVRAAACGHVHERIAADLHVERGQQGQTGVGLARLGGQFRAGRAGRPAHRRRGAVNASR